ncbi:MAG: ABC transporter ATP-binding protein [Dehalococcoidia bacterium]
MPERGEFVIRCEDLFKIYKGEGLEVVALRGLDFKVRYGEFMAVVGASGSGKSTLLNILAGLDRPSAGRAFVDDRDLLTMAGPDLVDYRRRAVGFVWQQTSRNLVPYLNLHENVILPMSVSGVGRDESQGRAAELLERVGLTDRMGNRPDQLSGGEQQRGSIAVALANRPPILLADEPTGMLDSIAAESVFAAFRRLNEEEGVTIVVVTHDPDIAARVDRVVAIRDGRTSAEIVRHVEMTQGVPKVVHHEYALVDTAGRIQIPREYLEQLSIRERARLVLGEGIIKVAPAEGEV